MKVSSLFKTGLSLGLGLILLASAAVSHAQSGAGEVLIAVTGGNEKEAVVRLTSAYGKVLEKTSDNLYRVAVRPGMTAEEVIAKLAKHPDVRFVLPGTSMEVIPGSLKSVGEHIQYLKAVNHLGGRAGDEQDEVEYYESLKDYLEARVGPDGVIDPEAYIEAAKHRDAMPAAPLPGGGAGSPGDLGTDNASGYWSYVGPKNLNVPYRTYYGVRPLSGRVNAIAVDHTNSNVIYVGSAGGGVHKSTDGGVNWSPRSDSWPMLWVSSLAIDPTNPNIIYAGTGDHHGSMPYGMGIMKSTNGGSTWTNVGAVMGTGAVSAIVIDNENPNIVIATTGRGGVGTNGRVWRSTDGGTTWAVAKTTGGADLPAANWCDLDKSAKNGATARRYWAVGSGTGNIWRSTNQGLTWSQIASPVAGAHSILDVAASKRLNGMNAVYLLVPTTNQIWRADDGGATTTPTWLNITGNFPMGNAGVGATYNWSQKSYDYHITTSVSNNDPATQLSLIYVGLITLAVNVGGASNAWTDIGVTYTGSAETHNDQHCYAPIPSNPTVGFQGCDGGIFRTTLVTVGTPANAVFTPLNRYLYTTQFYAMTVHPTNTSWVMGGTQDNASPASRGDLANWANPGAGDGSFCDIQDNNPNIQYHSWQFASVGRTTDGFGATNSEITPNYGGDSVPFIAPLTLGVGTQVANLYVGTNYLWRYNGTTNSWNARIGGTAVGAGGTVRAIGVATTNQDRLYTGASSGAVYKTDNIGAASPTWLRIDTGSPSKPANWVKRVAPRPGYSYDILVGMSTLGPGNLWRCANTTAATRVWTNVSGAGATALPSVPVNAIAHDPFNTAIWYVGTDVGVFMSSDSGGTWYNATNAWGLPNVRVDDLKVYNDGTNAYLYAATYGRGIWRIALGSLALSSISMPASVTGGLTTTGVIYLTARAGSTGQNVTVSSSNTAAIGNIGSVLVGPGQSSRAFSVPTKSVAVDTNVTMTATLGAVSKTDVILVKKPTLSSFTMSTSVVGGASFLARVALNTKAPTGGFAVNVGDNSTAVWGYSNPVTVPAGSLSLVFGMKSNPVTQAVTVTGSAVRDNIVKQDTVNVLPGGFYSMSFTSKTVTGGNNCVLVISTSGPAPTGGVTVNLSSTPAGLTLPATATIPAGSSSVRLSVPTASVRANTTIRATGTWGNTTRNASITVIP